MYGRKIVILSIILCILVGFYYFYDTQWVAKQKEEESEAKRIFTYAVETVEQIRLKNPKGSVVLEKKGKDWFIREPFHALADTWSVEQIINTVANEKWERKLEPLPKDLKVFGLSRPQTEITFTGTELKRPWTLYVGGENPTNTLLYLRVDHEPCLFMVRPYFRNYLDKSADDLRDKHVFRFDKEDVFRVAWQVAGKFFEGEKKEGRWHLIKPEGEDIPSEDIESLIWQLKSLTFRKVIEKPNHLLSYYGLAKPTASVQLMNEKGILIGEINFGQKQKPSPTYFARTGKSEAIYELNYNVVKGFPGQKSKTEGKPKENKGN
nr:DUF4340 domain-containing protein [Desulfobacterales bacterium]